MKIFKLIVLTLSLFNTLALSPSHAQPGSGVGGGRFTELQVRDFLGELITLFSYSDSLTLFPEVEKYNKTHEVTFLELMKSVDFKVVNEIQYFRGEERDCVPMVRDDQKWIQCYSGAIPENRLENQPLLYGFLLHEIFVYAGIEESKGKYIPSTYAASYRITQSENLSLVTLKKWVPKKGGVRVRGDIRKEGFTCTEAGDDQDHTSFFGLKKQLYLMVKPDGTYWLFKYGEPEKYSWYFGQGCDSNWGETEEQRRKSRKECAAWERAGKIRRALGMKPSLKVVAYGKFDLAAIDMSKRLQVRTPNEMRPKYDGESREFLTLFGFSAPSVVQEHPALTYAHEFGVRVLLGQGRDGGYTVVDSRIKKTLACETGIQLSLGNTGDWERLLARETRDTPRPYSSRRQPR